MPLSLVEVLILLAVGLVAGFLNTVAAGGSVITIPVLTAMVGPTVANGTNRIAILLQGMVGVTGYWRGGAMDWRATLPLIPPTVAGAVGGAWVATILSPGAIRKALAVAIVLVAGSALVKPSQWTTGAKSRLQEPWRSLVFAAIGFFGGFIQVGVGFFLLAALVLGTGCNLVRGNAAKMLLVFSYGPLVLLLFARAAQVDWIAGLCLGAGSMVGALIGSMLAVRGSAAWIRWVVVATALASAVSTLFA